MEGKLNITLFPIKHLQGDSLLALEIGQKLCGSTLQRFYQPVVNDLQMDITVFAMLYCVALMRLDSDLGSAVFCEIMCL